MGKTKGMKNGMVAPMKSAALTFGISGGKDDPFGIAWRVWWEGWITENRVPFRVLQFMFIMIFM